MPYLSGCYYHVASSDYNASRTKHNLSLLKCNAHATILSTAFRTELLQTFTNPTNDVIKECVYMFPLYDGVSVVRFTCHVGPHSTHGVVKEKTKARAVYDTAISRGETAGLLQQVPEAADVFTVNLGNIPAKEAVLVEIVFIGELKHDAEFGGIRYTIPTVISPRYGTGPATAMQPHVEGGIQITVDACMPEGSHIRGMQSPTHPIGVILGTTSSAPDITPEAHKASASLSLRSTTLDRDFVLFVAVKDVQTPKAILEVHPTIPNYRALMVSLVPNFFLPAHRPEIVFVVDRSGSMKRNIATLISAMKVYLRSLPMGVRFNICSFGWTYTFLWPKSMPYTQDNLATALRHTESFGADMGGTEIFAAIKATIQQRYTDIPCEIMLLTDGDIWHPEKLFEYLNQQVESSKGDIRLFSLGIGNAASSALIEGVARAGNGFAQTVGIGEPMDKKVVRMLKGALSPHVTDYTLEVRYAGGEHEKNDWEVVEKVTDGMRLLLSGSADEKTSKYRTKEQPPMSLFDPAADPDREDPASINNANGQDRYAHLPEVPSPKLLQAPHKILPLYSFTRSIVYLLMSPETTGKTPTSVILRATSSLGPLELDILVEILTQSGETLHQLAARKAVQDLEEGRGWIYDAKDENGVSLKERYPSRFGEMVEREVVRLGVQFQAVGKWCSFVAVSSDGSEKKHGRPSLSNTEDDEITIVSTMLNPHTSAPTSRGSDSPPAGAYKMYGMEDIPDDANRENGNNDVAGGTKACLKNLSVSEKSKHSAQRKLMMLDGDSYDDAHAQPSPSHKRTTESKAERSSLSPSGSNEETVYRKASMTPLPAHDIASGDAHSLYRIKDGPTQDYLGSASPGNVARHRKDNLGNPTTNDESKTHSKGVLENELDDVPSRKVSTTYLQACDRAIGPSCPPSTKPASTRTSPLHTIISLQHISGFWSPSHQLAQILSLTKETLKRGAKENRNIWTTVLVVIFLEEKMGESKGVWDLVVEKARAWLDREGVGDWTDLTEEAREVVNGVKG